jgi:hypothetical protein
MSRHVWGQPELKWDGFEPKPYVLDFDKVEKLQLKNAGSEEELTVGNILAKFQGQKVEVDDQILELVLKSPTGELVIKGPHFHRDILAHLYKFADQGVSPFDVRWFYYDSDSCREDPQSAYYFFLVGGNKILDERVTLSDAIGNGFDPSVLEPAYDPTTAVWFGERAWHEANTKLWYRKFYTETRTGELMVLRTDAPELYHYSAGRAGVGLEGWLSDIRRALSGIKLAIWVLVALSVLQLWLRWK